MNSEETIHVVLLASPFQGHMNPAIHLAIYLASRGLKVTIIITEDIHQKFSTAHHMTLDDMLSGHRRSGGLNIECAVVSDGLPLDFDRSGNPDRFFLSLLVDMMIHVEDIIVKLSEEGPPVSCLIADTFSANSVAIAEKLKLVHASLWTESIMVFSIYSHVSLLKEKGHYPSNDLCNDLIDYIPGVGKLSISDLPSYLQPPHEDTMGHRVVFDSFQSVKRTDFVLCNSVHELEQTTTVSTTSELNVPFMPIGPLHALNGGEYSTTSLWPELDCTEWLDSKPPGSVLYVSFGSLFGIKPAEREEIVRGIMLCHCNFLWILGNDGQNPFPQHLLDQLSGRGIFVSWCCQTKVLPHPAIFGFLTHCGWNSILESLWCEVPILAFPIFTDQFSNRKLIVDEWRIALDLERTQKLSREEVAEKIKELMVGETGKSLKERIRSLKTVTENAISPEGSSMRNLQHFIEELKKKAVEKAMIDSQVCTK